MYRTVDEGYFRLNIWAMGDAMRWMFEYEMMHTEVRPYESINDMFSKLFNEKGEKAALRWGPEVPGIASWKFSSNDGWLVTPIESKSAIDIWESADSPVPRHSDGVECSWWPEWIEYLRKSVELSSDFAVW